jgi:hypothetical protein
LALPNNSNQQNIKGEAITDVGDSKEREKKKKT